MAILSLSAYKFQITHFNKERNTTQYYPLNDVEGKSIITVIQEFCDCFKDYESNRQEKKVFKSEVLSNFEEYDNGQKELNFSAMMGRINSGEWGYTSDIVDPEDGSVVYTKPKDCADVLPFLFSVAIPYEDPEAVVGMIMLQNLGVFGIKTAFLKHLRQYFSENYSDCDLEISSLCPSVFARHILEDGQIKEIRLIRNLIPADEADGLGLCDYTGYTEWRYSNVSGLSHEKIQSLEDFITGKASNIREIIQIPQMPYDNVKFTVRRGHKNITLNLNNISNLNVAEEVSDAALGEDGHPVPDKFQKYFAQMYKDYAPYVGFRLR